MQRVGSCLDGIEFEASFVTCEDAYVLASGERCVVGDRGELAAGEERLPEVHDDAHQHGEHDRERGPRTKLRAGEAERITHPKRAYEAPRPSAFVLGRSR